jgi:hypothetical protein
MYNVRSKLQFEEMPYKILDFSKTSVVLTKESKNVSRLSEP